MGVLIFIFAIAPQPLHAADTPDWILRVLKQSEPTELAYSVYVDEHCPHNKQNVVSIVEGVIRRSRIEPLGGDALYSRSLYLSFRIDCISPRSSNPEYHANKILIFFGDASKPTRIFYNYRWASMNLADIKSSSDKIKRHVEDAITVYLEANF